MAVRRNSRKRTAILDKLQSTTSHPTAEWLYRELKDDYPEISLATVYRNLRMFQENGCVRSIATVNGNERFDAKTAAHNHFVCDTCTAVIDIELESDNGTNHYSDVGKELNATIRSHNVIFYGECCECSVE